MPDTLNEWAVLEQSARAAYEQGNLPEAERLLVQTWTAMHKQAAPRPSMIEVVGSLAYLREQQNDLNGAFECYQSLLALLKDMPNAESQVLRLLQKLAEISKTNGNYKAAEEYLTKLDRLKYDMSKKGPRWTHSVPALDSETVQPQESLIEREPPQQPVYPQPQNEIRTNYNSSKQAKSVQANAAQDESNGARTKALVRHDLPSLDSLVTAKEKFYFNFSVAVSVLVYLCTALFAIFYVPVLLLLSTIANGLFLGGIKSHSVKISQEQLPELHDLINEICQAMQMPVPTVYISNGEGMLNAFAIRLLSRDFVVIYSNILEMAFEKGEAEVAFVLAHELAHIKRGHTSRQWLRIPSHFIPFLSTAYSRACETTCDQFAAAICPEGAKWGLVSLAAGSKIYKRVSLSALYRQFEEDHGFWMWFHEILSTHPNLIKRIKNAGIGASQYDDIPQVENVPSNGKRRVPKFR